MYFKKSSMVSSQVMLLYSSHSFLARAVGVSRRWRDNRGDLSDLCASIVACHIINVHLWEKSWPLPRSSCIALSSSLCWTSFPPSVLLLFAVLPPSGGRACTVDPQEKHQRKMSTHFQKNCKTGTNVQCGLILNPYSQSYLFPCSQMLNVHFSFKTKQVVHLSVVPWVAHAYCAVLWVRLPSLKDPSNY